MPKTIREHLETSGLFRSFPESAKQKLAKLCRVQTFQHEDMVFQRGDKPTALYGVIDGAIKLIGETPNGKFFLYELASPGQWFGETSAIDGQARAQTSLAVGETQVVRLLRKDLLELLASQPDLYRHFVTVLCSRLRRAGAALEETAFLPISVRLARTLLRMHRVREKHQIKLSQEEIAASLGVTRQSIHRVMKKWHEKGYVSIEYGNVKVLKPSLLEQEFKG